MMLRQAVLPSLDLKKELIHDGKKEKYLLHPIRMDKHVLCIVPSTVLLCGRI